MRQVAVACRTAPAAVERWPLAEVLTIYIDVQTDRQLESWRHNTTLWQMRACASSKPGMKPDIPPLLRKIIT